MGIPKKFLKDYVLDAVADGLAHSINFTNFEREHSIIVNRNSKLFEIKISEKKTIPNGPLFSEPKDPYVKGIRKNITNKLIRTPGAQLLGATGGRVYVRFGAGDLEIKVIKKRK